MGNDIQFYSEHAQELKYSQQHKVRKLLEHNCIQYDGVNKVFVCLPVKGYNSTTYTLLKGPKGFVCTCQGFLTKVKKGESPTCSHIGALYEKLARRRL